MTNKPDRKRMTASQAAHKLEDVLKWRLLPATPVEPVSAIRYDKDPTPSSTETRFPFPVDTVRQDGARGVETMAGADTWIELWATWLAWALDRPLGNAHGAWLLMTLQDDQALNPLPDDPDEDEDTEAAEDTRAFLSEWDKFTKELTILWWRLANTTGHAPKRRATCPKCNQGWLQSKPGRKGFTDEVKCSNPACDTQGDWSDEEIRATQRAILRDPEISDMWVTAKDARTIWPRLNPSTLRSWANRNQVKKNAEGRYNLTDINRQQWDKHRMI